MSPKFSRREEQVINHLIAGGTVRTFAAEHGIKSKSVTTYLMRAKEKVSASTTIQLCVIYLGIKWEMK